MTVKVVRSLGVKRNLKWASLVDKGTTGNVGLWGIYGPLKGMEEGRCGRSWPQLEGFEMILAIREFSGFIDEFDVNPPLGGGIFTWCGEKDGSFKARSLKDNGIRMEDKEELNGGIATYFKSVFENSQVKRPDLAVDLFKGDAVFQGILLVGFLCSQLQCYFVALIPNKGGAKEIKDFRLINLVDSPYKLLAKRLKRIVRKVVLEFQNVFVRGKQILDATLIATEIVCSRKRSSRAGLVSKLDI
ncbi:hypothetical protein CK203_038907 [Vitis vinifera]|uniref:Reverse transcriptase domain-containing protein n=1 Tax=Vitis vinifera TaxID=29760 RepID=A0A438HG94_VITVI|nr:hypothetical protein CK203_038907 [Vitis vinifera]